MADLKKLIELVKTESGKVFIVDAEGEIGAVIMGMDEYENLVQPNSMRKIYTKINRLNDQADELNQIITKIQKDDLLEEVMADTQEQLNQSQPIADTTESVYIEPIVEEE